ncbi:FAD-binding and (Fe-S)-binding domain-containing protein [Bradyrhizobium sp. STM 3562]|uniref:FAD-binding and (Fe-S)-binding domain-containing protein n=1 Tax=Bradyrhizobium sp. STM 3562 TaxID=578924 RepID=UPI00388E553B
MNIVPELLPRTPYGRGEGTDAVQRRRREAARDLNAELQRRVKGEVRFEAGARALYATDLSIYRHVPIGVVIPRDADDVIAAVESCRPRGVPIFGRGCGTSLSGQCCNVAVVIDFSKHMNRLLAIDPDARLARVEPGLINDQLREAAERHGLTFAPDPATHQYCTLGGNIGNNSCGAHTFWGGKTVDNVEELDVLTYDGLRTRVGETSEDAFELIQRGGGRRAEIYRRLRELAGRYGEQIRARYPKIPRRVSGYNLDSLLPENGFHVARALVGSESTCALTLAATVKLRPSPSARSLLVLGYHDLAEAGDDVPAIRELGALALEGIDEHVVVNMRRKAKSVAGAAQLPDGHAWLLLEFGGEDQRGANRKAETAYRRLQRIGTRSTGMRVIEDRKEQAAVWHVRESGVGSSHIPLVEEAWPSWEDAAVPPDRLGPYLRDFKALCERYGYAYTAFGHFGDGCIHARMTFGLRTTEGVARFRAYMEEASDLCLSYGGSLSGEHGDGQAKAELLPKMFGPDLIQAFREFKAIWDPHWRMNPGKIIDPQPLDADLRLGPDYHPRQVKTHFKFPDDRGSFATAAERCFGVGKCRSLGGQVMCPSFQATREEMHSTRGRAHLLFEMMRGDELKRGWREEAVREALDLCLQCKGCKHDCPVSVDMATYKAEFLSHYYARRARPAAAYSMGLVFAWARLAAVAPGFTNLLVQSPVVGSVLRRVAGFAHEREPPKFSAETFQHWFLRNRHIEDRSRPPVILWPDTFNNYFLPGTAKAAVTVLEDAGYRVLVPAAPLCCGRPLYDYGMLGLAKRKLNQVLDALRPAIRTGVPVVGLEPSCVSVFRDELVNLMPDDGDAHRLAKQTMLLSEFLMKNPHWKPPRFERAALAHAHCHHRSVLEFDAQQKMFDAMGLKVDYPKLGCCGQAGSFGYEAEHYDVSMKIAEQELLPAVRKAPADTLIVADGFSCREQILHGAHRWAMHPAEVLALAVRARQQMPAREASEAYREAPARLNVNAAIAGVGAVAALGLLLYVGFGRSNASGKVRRSF